MRFRNLKTGAFYKRLDFIKSARIYKFRPDRFWSESDFFLVKKSLFWGSKKSLFWSKKVTFRGRFRARNRPVSGSETGRFRARNRSVSDPEPTPKPGVPGTPESAGAALIKGSLTEMAQKKWKHIGKSYLSFRLFFEVGPTRRSRLFGFSPTKIPALF